jgi:hypothetical protein
MLSEPHGDSSGLEIQCGHCGQRYSVPDRHAGKQVQCPACRQLIAIPKVAFVEPEPDLRPLPPDPMVGLLDEAMAERSVVREPVLWERPAEPLPSRLKRRLPFRAWRWRSDTVATVVVIVAMTAPGLWYSIPVLSLMSEAGVNSLGLSVVWLSGAAWNAGFWWVCCRAFRESIFCGVLYVVIPCFYPLYYMITRWHRVQLGATISLLGFSVYTASIVGSVMQLDWNKLRQRLEDTARANEERWSEQDHRGHIAFGPPGGMEGRRRSDQPVQWPNTSYDRSSSQSRGRVPNPHRPSARTSVASERRVIGQMRVFISTYRGHGDPQAAAQRALREIAWLSAETARVDLVKHELVVGVVSNSVDTKSVREALQRAGFVTGPISVNVGPEQLEPDGPLPSTFRIPPTSAPDGPGKRPSD